MSRLDDLRAKYPLDAVGNPNLDDRPWQFVRYPDMYHPWRDTYELDLVSTLRWNPHAGFAQLRSQYPNLGIGGNDNDEEEDWCEHEETHMGMCVACGQRVM